MPDLDAYREQASGLVVMRLGNNMPPPRRAEDEAAGIHRLLERYPFAGLILFNGAWPQTRQTLIDLQRATSRPLLVMTDMERGLGQQVRGATLFPHALAFESLGEESVEAFARVAAREALACGVHAAFAPVVDVSRNPRNPIISTRAFGTNAETASRLGAAFVRGARAEGLLTTAKHFPGHGNTEEDSHATLPTVRDSREEMDREDLPPFRAAFAAGADLVMTAHVAYPALDPSGRPATLSKPILTGLLRDELGFEGVVISDSLQMAGIQASDRTEAEVAAEQILAGVDLLLDPQNPETLIEGLARAIASGDLPEARVQEALGRADRLRRHLTDRFGGGLWTDPSAMVPQEEVGAEAHLRQAERVAREAVRLEGTVPFKGGEGVVAVLVRSHTSPLDPEEQPLAEALRQALPGVAYHEVSPQTPEAAREAAAEAARGARAVLLALVVKPAAWHAFGLPPELEALAKRVVDGRPAAVAALGAPVALEGFEGAEARLVTFSDTPVAQRALAWRLSAG